MNDFVARYQTLIGFFMVCFTLAAVSGNGWHAGGILSSPAYAQSAPTCQGAACVYGSPHVANAAFPVVYTDPTTGRVEQGAVAVMSDGNTLNFLYKLNGTSGTFGNPSGVPLAIDASGTLYAVGSDRHLYEAVKGEGVWRELSQSGSGVLP